MKKAVLKLINFNFALSTGHQSALQYSCKACNTLLFSKFTKPEYKIKSNAILNFNLKCLSTSIKKQQLSNENNKSDNNKVIYYGTLTSKIKGVKVFTLISSTGGLAIQPMVLQNILQGGSVPLYVALCTCVGFFTFVTPFLIHMLTSKYVNLIQYNAKTDTYTATTLSFFIREKHLEFTTKDVVVPESIPVFTSVCIKNKPLFIDSSCFYDMRHYIRIMGYDKPIDLKLGTPVDEPLKDSSDFNGVEEEKVKIKSKAV